MISIPAAALCVPMPLPRPLGPTNAGAAVLVAVLILVGRGRLAVPPLSAVGGPAPLPAAAATVVPQSLAQSLVRVIVRAAVRATVNPILVPRGAAFLWAVAAATVLATTAPPAGESDAGVNDVAARVSALAVVRAGPPRPGLVLPRVVASAAVPCPRAGPVRRRTVSPVLAHFFTATAGPALPAVAVARRGLGPATVAAPLR